MILAAMSNDPVLNKFDYDIAYGDSMICFHPMLYPTRNTDPTSITFAGTQLPDDLKYGNVVFSLNRSLHYTDKPTLLFGYSSVVKTEIMIVEDDELHSVVMQFNLSSNHVTASITSANHESQSQMAGAAAAAGLQSKLVASDMDYMILSTSLTHTTASIRGYVLRANILEDNNTRDGEMRDSMTFLSYVEEDEIGENAKEMKHAKERRLQFWFKAGYGSRRIYL